jgi:hypothetical protein
MEKYILIHENPIGSTSSSAPNNVVAVVGTTDLLDYDVELVSEIPAFKTYSFDDHSLGSLNINLILSSAMEVNKIDTAKKFMISFQKSFEALFTSTQSTVDFYPPSGVVMGTVST